MLRSYAAEVLRSNPGSTVFIVLRGQIFQGIYICFEACKQGFLMGYRSIIGLDGCHLRGNYGGQLLTAVAYDANDYIYHVAYAVVEKENTASWRWFVQHLAHDLGIDDNNKWTFMTDRQKGLQNVLDDLFPAAKHRFCVRHMYQKKFTSGFKDRVLKEYLWRAAKAITVVDYLMWMQQIRQVSEEAHGWLMKRDPREWSKSHFQVKVKSDIVLNNGCEVFNKTLRDDKEKSILTMLTSIQVSFMKRIQVRRDKMRAYNGTLCPKIKRKLARNIELADGCDIDWSGGPQYQVKSAGGQYVVNLEQRTCACRRWELTGIPCSHAIAVIADTRNQPDDYVDRCYAVETYLACYENILNPINGSFLWPTVDALPIEAPQWKDKKRGKTQKKRRKGDEEDYVQRSQGKDKLSKKGLIAMTCSICGGKGHNKRYHSRTDAPDSEWFNTSLELVCSDIVQTQGPRRKLIPNRGSVGQSTEPDEGPSNFSPPEMNK